MKEMGSESVHSQVNEELVIKPCPVRNSGVGTNLFESSLPGTDACNP